MTPRELGLTIARDADHERARRRVRAMVSLIPAGQPAPLLSAVRETLFDLTNEFLVWTRLLCEALGGPECPLGPWAPLCEPQRCEHCWDRPESERNRIGGNGLAALSGARTGGG